MFSRNWFFNPTDPLPCHDSKRSTSCPPRNRSEFGYVAHRLNNESNQAKASRSARGSLGHNSIAIYDPMHDFPASASNTDIQSASGTYTQNLGPFLPALPKSGDPGHVNRIRKTRELQRKRLNRTQNLFPS